MSIPSRVLSSVRAAALRNFKKSGPKSPFNLSTRKEKPLDLDLRKQKRQYIAEKMEKVASTIHSIEAGKNLSSQNANFFRLFAQEKKHIQLILSSVIPEEKPFIRETIQLILASTRNASARMKLYQKILPVNPTKLRVKPGRKSTRSKGSAKKSGNTFSEGVVPYPGHYSGPGKLIPAPFRALFSQPSQSLPESERMKCAAELVHLATRVIQSPREYRISLARFKQNSALMNILHPIAEGVLTVKPASQRWAAAQVVQILASSLTWEEALAGMRRMRVENPRRFLKYRFSQ